MTESVECLLCADPCIFFGVFDCGHFACGFCAIRIFSLSKENKSCPVCRHDSKELIATRDLKYLSHSDHQFDVTVMKAKATMIPSGMFPGILVDGVDLERYLMKMNGFVCPVPNCWQDGVQDHFGGKDMLRTHLRKEHSADYCGICLENKPAFLCEHKTYGQQGELDQHNRGLCSKDPTSFTGHPPCHFCGNRRFYDGEGLLKHMQQSHITCDICNSGEFIFTFYRNREKLLEHFQASHKLCQHPDCKDLDPMLRVFRSDFDLAAHLQSQHNVRHNFTMEAFTPASNSRTPAAPSRGNQVASGANSFATKITFDFVNRKQVLDLDAPVREGGGGSRGGGGRGRGRGKSQAPHTAISSASRLPSHYEGRTDYFGPVRVPIAAGEIAIREAYGQSTSEGDEGAQMKVLNKALGEIGGFRKGSHTSRGSMGNRELSSASSASTMSAVARVDTVVHNDIEAINALPTTLAERNMLLKERLDQLLPQSSSKAAFVDACKDFLAGKLLATEHYKQLSGTFFRDESSLNAIFPLIVATMPNEHKKEALMTARRMLTCNEFQRQERANHESEESKHEREEIEQLRASRLNNLSKGGKGKQGAWGAKPPAPTRPGSTVKDGKKDRKDTSIQSFLAPSSSASASGPKGVWTTSTTRNLVGVPAPASPSLPQPTKKRDTNEVARGESAYGAGVNPGGGWGGTAASSGANAYLDPEALPTLETMAPRWSSSATKTKSKGNPSSSNPWFRR